MSQGTLKGLLSFQLQRVVDEARLLMLVMILAARNLLAMTLKESLNHTTLSKV